MTEPLSAERRIVPTLETLILMRESHIERDGECLSCYIGTVDPVTDLAEHCMWPCDAALLLAELDRREANPPRWRGRNHQSPVPHLALLVGVQDTLLGPAEDLC